MRMPALTLGIILPALLACLGRAAEVPETYRNAYGNFLQGRFDDSASGYRYIDTLGLDAALPSSNLALLARDAGRPEETLPLWTKATILSPADAFLWNQRGWSYLSMGRAKEARENFLKAVEVSSSTASTAEGQFGLGMTETLESNLKTAITAFQGAVIPSPYTMAATAAMLGRIAVRLRRPSVAELYLKQSFRQDPVQPEIVRDLAQVYEKLDDPKSAWLAYKAALDMDPRDAAALKGIARVAKVIVERPERLLSVRRLAGPMVQKFMTPPASDLRRTVRVGLYSDASGVPGYVKRFFFMSGSDFRITHPQLGIVNRGNANEQWEASVSPETNVVELRDVHHQVQYTTKQSFRIEPSFPGASVLIKNVELTDIKGIDPGDLEVRGSVEAVPTASGLQLVNEVGVEQYLYGQVAAAMPAASPMEALKAQAVASRTRLEWAKRHSTPDLILRMDMCDSRRCLPYAGVSMENESATRAVQETEGVTLSRGGQLLEARQHLYCGGVTEENVADSPVPAAPRSVDELERMSHGYPSKTLYCEGSALSLPSWARWLRVLDADALRSRVEAERYIGRLEHVRVLRRSQAGRVQALEAVGYTDTAAIEGEAAIEAFLSPGGLRSTLFTLQPLYEGHTLRWLLVWGVGTGDGHGLCAAGAMGLASAGKDYAQILRHYFPGAVLDGASASGSARPLPGKARKASTSRRALREKLKAKAKTAGDSKNRE